jgi:antirestriction protein ArdC
MPTPTQIRQQITQQVIQALETNTIPWRRPWRSSPNALGAPTNVVSRRPYSGINILLLQLHALRHGLQSKWFATFDQWKALGGAVKKRPDDVKPGQWGCQIVFYRPISKTVVDIDTGDEQEKSFQLLKTYTVFGADQVDGAKLDKYRVKEEKVQDDVETLVPAYRRAGQLIEATQAKIIHGGNKAFYIRPLPEDSWPHHTDGDRIHVPDRCQFNHLAMYHETLLHELSHWAEVRVGLDHRKQGYPMGELVAEMSSCFLAAELGIPSGEGLANHAAYLKTWLEAMKGDATYIFKAATYASRITDYLLKFEKQEQIVGELEGVGVG